MAKQSLLFDCRPYGLELGLRITLNSSVITEVEFFDGPVDQHQSVTRDKLESSVLSQIQAYLSGQRKQFELPIKASGSDFQQRVWQQMQLIPYGEVRSYGQLAVLLGSSARAVGGACRANPLPLIIPCHRVVAAKGIGGFAGDARGGRVLIKEWLLSHEQA